MDFLLIYGSTTSIFIHVLLVHPCSSSCVYFLFCFRSLYSDVPFYHSIAVDVLYAKILSKDIFDVGMITKLFFYIFICVCIFIFFFAKGFYRTCLSTLWRGCRPSYLPLTSFVWDSINVVVNIFYPM